MEFYADQVIHGASNRGLFFFFSCDRILVHVLYIMLYTYIPEVLWSDILWIMCTQYVYILYIGSKQHS